MAGPKVVVVAVGSVLGGRCGGPPAGPARTLLPWGRSKSIVGDHGKKMVWGNTIDPGPTLTWAGRSRPGGDFFGLGREF